MRRKRKIAGIFLGTGLFLLLCLELLTFWRTEELMLELGVEKQDVLYDYEVAAEEYGNLRFLIYRQGDGLGIVSAKSRKAFGPEKWLKIQTGKYELLRHYLVDLTEETVNTIHCEDLWLKGLLFQTDCICRHEAKEGKVYLGVARKDSAWMTSPDIRWVLPVEEGGDMVLFLAITSDARLFADVSCRLWLQ